MAGIYRNAMRYYCVGIVIFSTLARGYHQKLCYEYLGCPNRPDASSGGMRFVNWQGDIVSQFHSSKALFDDTRSPWQIEIDDENFPMEFYVGKYNIRESLALSIRRNRFAYKPRNPSLAMTADISLPAAYRSTFVQSSDASEILLLRSRGSKDSPNDAQQNDALGYITFKSSASGRWYAVAQVYSSLQQTSPGVSKSGGGLAFASSSHNYADTHELVDRFVINSVGNILQRRIMRTMQAGDEPSLVTKSGHCIDLGGIGDW